MNENTITVTSSLASVTFNSTGPFRLIAPLRGWGRADVRTPTQLNSGADGGYISEQFQGFRQIPLDVVLRATTYEDLRVLQQQLFDAMPLNETVEVRLQTPTNEQYVSFAKLVNNMDPRDEGNGRVSYGIELLSEDPIIYDYTEGNEFEQVVPKKIAGGLLWESDGLYWDDGGSNTGLFWEAGSQGTIINNTGAVAVYPDVIITGSAINPVLRNDTVQQTLSFNLTMTTTDTLEISMYLKTALLNGMNVFNSINQENFWPLVQGANRIVFETSGGSDTAEALIRWRPGYLGVM